MAGGWRVNPFSEPVAFRAAVSGPPRQRPFPAAARPRRAARPPAFGRCAGEAGRDGERAALRRHDAKGTRQDDDGDDVDDVRYRCVFILTCQRARPIYGGSSRVRERAARGSVVVEPLLLSLSPSPPCPSPAPHGAAHPAPPGQDVHGASLPRAAASRSAETILRPPPPSL